MNAVSICEAEIKKALNLSPELVLVDGIALGYPEEDSPLNQIPRYRLPVGEVTDWR
jgi:nitroreductase